LLSQADIIIDETYEFSNGNFIRMESFLAAHQINSTVAAGIKAITNRQVYSLAGTTGQPITRAGSPNIGTVGLDWFERGTTRSDEVRWGWPRSGRVRALLMLHGQQLCSTCCCSDSRWLLRCSCCSLGPQVGADEPVICWRVLLTYLLQFMLYFRR